MRPRTGRALPFCPHRQKTGNGIHSESSHGGFAIPNLSV